MLLLFRQAIVDRREGHPGAQHRMRRDILDPLPFEIHLPAVAKAEPVLLERLQSHCGSSLSAGFPGRPFPFR